MDEKMKSWVTRNRDDPAVRNWLAGNPPPAEWQGTALEWAYTEMPFAPE